MSSVEPTATRSAPSDSPAPADDAALIKLLREELLKTQLMVLDLNDQKLVRETEKADAVALLGQIELVLERTLQEAAELTQRRNAEVSTLRTQLGQAEIEGRNRRAEITSLTERMAAADQALAQLQIVADTRARDLAATAMSLAETQTQLERTRAALAGAEGELATECRRLELIFQSALWRLGRPWRALFGPKV